MNLVDTVYLDHAATTPLLDVVRAAMEPFLDERFGNPSSRHTLGVRAAEAIDAARETIARALFVRPEGVVFTSGGTEANNLAVLGFARAKRRQGAHVLYGATEHSSVRAAALALVDEGFEVEAIPAAPDGGIDFEALASKLREDTVLVAQMLVNNEFGTIYPLRRVATLVRERAPRAHLHVDAVQGIGKLDLDLEALGGGSYAISAHKIHGPKGTGALVLTDPAKKPRPLVFGGNQENGLRSGTENVAGIVGFASAVEAAVRDVTATHAHLAALRARLAEGLRGIEGTELLDPAPASGLVPSPAIAAVRLPGAPAEVWLHHLAQHGVLTSVGSACQARNNALSPALLALGLAADEARSVLRISFSRTSSAADVEAALAALARVAGELRVAGARP